jgi:hypothetical protein
MGLGLAAPAAGGADGSRMSQHQRDLVLPAPIEMAAARIEFII